MRYVLYVGSLTSKTPALIDRSRRHRGTGHRPPGDASVHQVHQDGLVEIGRVRSSSTLCAQDQIEFMPVKPGRSQ